MHYFLTGMCDISLCMTTPSVLLICFSLPVSESIMSHRSASSLRTLWILQKCYATHKTVNVSGPASASIIFKEFVIEAAFGGAPDSRDAVSPNSSNSGPLSPHPPQAARCRARPSPRGYKKPPLWQMASDCLTFLKCSDWDVWIAECLVGLCSGWRHRCLSQRNSTSSTALSDRRIWRHLGSPGGQFANDGLRSYLYSYRISPYIFIARAFSSHVRV